MAAYTPTTFKARWTEFTPVADALVTSALAEATRECDARVFGTRIDDAIGLLAAHKLAISPQGQAARLVAKDGSTTYGTEWARIARQRAGGPWAVGQTP